MKKQIRKWILRFIATGLLLVSLLLVIVLNPTLLYANKTIFGNYTVYHNSPLDNNFKTRLTKATELLERSEIYNPKLKIDICLNDGSIYPKIIQSLQSPAFGIGFYNKVVIMGSINWKDNYDELNGYKWNLTQLIVHETIHCLQFNKLGFWKSNPVAKYPSWKWEGYNEYVARQNPDQIDLLKNIDRFNLAEQKDKDAWGISFADSTFVGKYYYKWWMLMQFCLDIKKMTYMQVLKDTTQEETAKQQMMFWYNGQKKK